LWPVGHPLLADCMPVAGVFTSQRQFEKRPLLQAFLYVKISYLNTRKK
jgi:hypothetical protein